MKKIIQPSYLKSKAFKRLEKEWNKPPKVKIMPRDRNNKEDIKKAKMMQKLMNHMFDTNAQGITSKYMQVMKLAQDKFLYEEMKGIRVSWDTTQKLINNIAKEPKKYADLLGMSTDITGGQKPRKNKKI